MSRADNRAQVLKNHRIVRRTRPATTATAVTPDLSRSEHYSATALSTALTINDPVYSKDGDDLTIRLRDNGTSRALTWGTTFRWPAGALAATTVGKTHLLMFKRNDAENKWENFINLAL